MLRSRITFLPAVVTFVVLAGSSVQADLVPQKMYWTEFNVNVPDSARIRWANLDGTGDETLVSSGLSAPIGIDVDAIHGKMYWTDHRNDRIQRSDLDGSNIETIVDSGLASPWSISLDAAGGKVYWTDLIFERIQRANLDGSDVETLVSTSSQGGRLPRGRSARPGGW